ncbi:MAG: glycosyltransferase family 2 protein [Lachnospiraceae bacterium]|nr:glycosyltransferase family 2 protein [Lachnospiraceae bacterium]
MAFLSIIVPAYNVENYIRECVDSILAQTFTDFELILVDDGSTDSTGRICDDYAGKDSRIRVLHKENGGLVSARKAGLSDATGEYATYVDGDDWIAPSWFADLCNTAKKEDADIVIADFTIAREKYREPFTQIMEGGIFVEDKIRKDIYSCMLCKGEYFSFGFQPSLWSKLFRRELLVPYQTAVDERIRLGEDAACFYPCVLEAKKVVYLKGYHGYFYRMRETSISHAIVRSFYTEEIFLLITHLEKSFSEKEELWGLLEEQLWAYACYMLDNMLTPHLRFKELFWGKELTLQFKRIASSHIGKNVVEYGKKVRTSSRMKRILKTMEIPGLRNKLELYLFCIYENWQNRKLVRNNV